jgi:16S rRNA (guanine527-N7)-methyltransferase
MKTLKEGAAKLRIELTGNQLKLFEVYYRELVAWNRRINLTAITDYEEVQVKHFLDSLTLLLVIGTYGERPRVIDIGTGGGLPGIPLKIVQPGIRLTLLEATEKKVRFLYNLVDKLGLQGVTIVTGRAEVIAHDEQYREKYDLAVSRAVAALPVLVELVLPFCAPGGFFIAQKAGDIEKEINQSMTAIEIVGGRLREVKRAYPDDAGDERKLVIIEKTGQAPEKYPRRPGIPVKRPMLSRGDNEENID